MPFVRRAECGPRVRGVRAASSARSAAHADPASSTDFWAYWTGQTISTLGSSFTTVVLPLLVFQLTHSPVSLALTVAVSVAPYLLFGLAIGAWVDRADRRRLMLLTDLVRAVAIASVPLVASTHHLTVWWLYGVSFLTATLSIGFDAANFAAVPSLVAPEEIVRANGRIQASYAVARALGPFIAGLLLVVAPPEQFLLLDAASFLVSAVSLAIVRASFNTSQTPSRASGTSLGRDIAEGLHYVLGHPILRALAGLLLLINLLIPTVGAQLVYFVEVDLRASTGLVGFFYAAVGASTVLCSLIARRLSARWTLSGLMLGGLAVEGLAIVAVAAVALVHAPWVLWAALLLWTLRGTDVLFGIGSYSLVQRLVPNELLGRVITLLRVLTWPTASIGAIVGGLAIQGLGTAVPVFAVIGLAVCLAALGFARTPLGCADRVLPPLGRQTEKPQKATPG